MVRERRPTGDAARARVEWAVRGVDADGPASRDADPRHLGPEPELRAAIGGRRGIRAGTLRRVDIRVAGKKYGAGQGRRFEQRHQPPRPLAIDFLHGHTHGSDPLGHRPQGRHPVGGQGEMDAAGTDETGIVPGPLAEGAEQFERVSHGPEHQRVGPQLPDLAGSLPGRLGSQRRGAIDHHHPDPRRRPHHMQRRRCAPDASAHHDHVGLQSHATSSSWVIPRSLAMRQQRMRRRCGSYGAASETRAGSRRPSFSIS